MTFRFAVGVIGVALLLGMPNGYLGSGNPAAAEGPLGLEEHKLETFQEQLDFFNQHWPAMKTALESGGADAAIAFINDTAADDLERRVFYAFARTGMTMQEWEGRSLDAYITVLDAGIAECLRQADAAADEETADKRTNTANVISYNLGADLAFCWGDDFERWNQHFERGIQAGNDCIRWRKELGNPPMTLSMAYWLRGVHHLALDDLAKALDDFAESLSYAEQAARDEGNPTTLADGDAMIVLAHGWVELTRKLTGDAGAQAAYDNVVGMFRAQVEGDDDQMRDDAQFFIMQLEEAEKQMAESK